MKNLDIIIPVYNEGENIANVLDSLKVHVQTPHRILICYDSDSDTTLPVVREYLKYSDSTIALVKNNGVGVRDAVLSGFAAGNAQAKLVFPADDLYNASIVDSMYEHWKEGAEIVVASRFVEGGCMVGCPWLKAILVRSAAFTLRHLGRLPINDPTNGLKLYSGTLLKREDIETKLLCHQLIGH